MVAATEATTCLGFAMDCGVVFKGAGVTVAGIALFFLSVYVLLAAIFGRWLGYLVLTVALSGWMILLSGLWFFGFWSQGPETPTNLGPRGAEPGWLVAGAGLDAHAEKDQAFDLYPAAPWTAPDPLNEEQAADIQSVQGAASAFLAEQANEELGLAHGDLRAITPTQFSVESIRFADTDDGSRLAVVEAYFAGGGPLTAVSLYYDQGSVSRYSLMFMVASIVLFAIHLPLLDRAEHRRKAFLTGGSANPWYGPA